MANDYFYDRLSSFKNRKIRCLDERTQQSIKYNPHMIINSHKTFLD